MPLSSPSVAVLPKQPNRWNGRAEAAPKKETEHIVCVYRAVYICPVNPIHVDLENHGCRTGKHTFVATVSLALAKQIERERERQKKRSEEKSGSSLQHTYTFIYRHTHTHTHAHQIWYACMACPIYFRQNEYHRRPFIYFFFSRLQTPLVLMFYSLPLSVPLCVSCYFALSISALVVLLNSTVFFLCTAVLGHIHHSGSCDTHTHTCIIEVGQWPTLAWPIRALMSKKQQQ